MRTYNVRCRLEVLSETKLGRLKTWSFVSYLHHSDEKKKKTIASFPKAFPNSGMRGGEPGTGLEGKNSSRDTSFGTREGNC